jgi:salicylate hydroxylase
MAKDFEGWGRPILQLLDTFKEPQKWALFDSRAAKTYTKGRVCLLGDAAHASTPHQGAGAGMAFEDACIMTHLLSEVFGSQDTTAAFRIFNKFRRPRTQGLVSTSRAAGQVFEFTHKGIMDNIDSIRKNLNFRHSWIWNFDKSSCNLWTPWEARNAGPRRTVGAADEKQTKRRDRCRP